MWASPSLPADAAAPARPAPGSTAAFVRRALATVRRRAPARYVEVAACLARAPGRYAVGDERFTISGTDGRTSVRAGWRGPYRAVVETTPEAVVALFDGAASLEEALATEELVVRADADALLDLSSAVAVFAAEAVSATVYARQFEEYRSWAARA
jgi:hypothetical protein